MRVLPQVILGYVQRLRCAIVRSRNRFPEFRHTTVHSRFSTQHFLRLAAARCRRVRSNRFRVSQTCSSPGPPRRLLLLDRTVLVRARHRNMCI